MPDTELCPKCRSPIPANALGAACPRCLMGLAVEAGASTHAGSAGPFNPPSVEELNDRLADADLEAISLIGCGGMGAVYRARQKRLDRIVALKVLPPSRARDVSFAERFLREARALAKLNHPHIVAVYDAGQVGRHGESAEFLYIVMEFVDGASLREVMHTGRLSPREAMRLAPQLCDAIQYAHDRGVVHRDLKPENILLDADGRARVADFGLAKVSRPTDQPPAAFSLTDVDARMGTPRYMAPEQMNVGADVDHRADIYSLGVLLYEMLTGELPAAADYTPPSRRAEVDGRIDQVVERSLKSSPADRYQQASQVKRDVERIASDAPARLMSRGRWLAVAAVAAAAVAVVPLIRSRLHPEQKTPPAARSPEAVPFAGAPPLVASIDGNWALEFDGATCHVSIPSLKRDYPWPITMEAWIDAPRPARPTVIFTVGGAADCGLSASDENWFVTDPGLRGNYVEKPFAAGLTHFAYVADAREGRLYLNGEEVDRKPMHEMPPKNDRANLHAWIGAAEAQAGSGQLHYRFRGKIDELRVSKVARYDKAFTPSRRFEPDADTVALYHCDEGGGDTLNDASGHGHTGRVTGARWTAAAPAGGR